MYTSEYRAGDVSVRLSYPLSNQPGERHANLVIIDRPSGMTVIDVRISADQLLNLFSGSLAELTGAAFTKYPERIGKKALVTSKALRGHNVNGIDIDEEAQEWKDQFLADGWEAVRIDRTNYGRNVVAHRWVVENESAGSGKESATGTTES